MGNSIKMTDLQKSYILGSKENVLLGGNISRSYFEIECLNYNLDKIVEAIKFLFDSHELMHCVIKNNEILEVLEDYNLDIEIENLTNSKIKEALEEKRKKIFNISFDLENEIQVKCFISIIGEKDIIIHFYGNGVIFDGLSHEIIIKELNKLLKNQKIDSELSFSKYIEIIEESKDINLNKQDLDFWINNLKDIDYAPDLPRKMEEELIKEGTDFTIYNSFPKDKWNKLEEYARKKNLSVFSILLTFFGKTLDRYSNNSKFLINIPFTKRPFYIEGSENTIGLCSDFGLFKYESNIDKNLLENFYENQEKILDMQDHYNCTGMELIHALQKENGNQVSIPVTFTSTIDATQKENKDIKKIYVKTHTSQVWIETFITEINDEIVISMNFIKELFDEKIANGIANTFYENLIKFIDNQYEFESSFSIDLSKMDKDIIEKINDTDKEEELPKLINKLNNNFIKYADKIAIEYEQGYLTYKKVKEYGDKISTIIYDKYKNKDVIKVGLYLKKSWKQIVSAVSLISHGMVYMPIDYEMTPSELEYCYNTAELTCIISEDSLLKNVIDANITDYFDINNLINVKDIIDVKIPKNSTDTAIIINTSGTTGKPKSIQLSYEGISNCLNYSEDIFKISSEDTCIAITNFCHDMAIFDTLGMFWCGGKVVVPTAGKEKDPKHWEKIMSKYNVNIWNSVPALMEMLILSTKNLSDNILNNMKLITLGGDWISKGLAEDVLNKCKNASIYSVGGPTETCIWNIFHKISKKDVLNGKIPYGIPFPNTKYFILNNNMELCPIGVEGNMFVAGKGVSAGYIGLKEENTKKFVKYNNKRVYNTNDRGKYSVEGNIEILGRSDNQVKINGKRIELSGIENVINKINGVISSVVVINSQTKKLIAYYTANKEIISSDSIRCILEEKLSNYMIPQKIIYLEKIPITKNGKIDRKYLENLKLKEDRKQLEVKGELENGLINIVKEALSLDNVNLTDNFFALGGDSVSAMKIVSDIEEKMKVELSVYDILNNPVLTHWLSKLEELLSKKNSVLDNISIENELLELVKNLLNNDEFDIEDSFIDEGGDIEMAKKISEFLEKRFNLEVSPYDIVVSPYIEDWIEMINKK